MMGHRGAVLVAAYNPKMFKGAAAASGGAPDLCLALGSQVRVWFQDQGLGLYPVIVGRLVHPYVYVGQQGYLFSGFV